MQTTNERLGDANRLTMDTVNDWTIAIWSPMHGGTTNIQELSFGADTFEVEIPDNVYVQYGGDHQHSFANRPAILVRVSKRACRWCKAGY